MTRLDRPGEDEATINSVPVNNLSVAKKKYPMKNRNAVSVPAQAPVPQILIVVP